jgi:hypothetical protein
MSRIGFEEVKGRIIGEIEISGTLHRYGTGEQQGPRFFDETESGLIEKAREWYNDAGGRSTYPDGLELRIR